jgi:copper(I)-binding protein
MKKFTNIFLVALCLFVLASCAKSESIQIKSAWIRPGIMGNTSAAYFVIDNPTDQADKLLSVTGEIADSVEIHLSSMENGNMSMLPQESVEIPPTSQVAFKPQGLHVMLVNLHQALNVGDQVQLEFVFEKAGTIKMTIEVSETGNE